MKTKSILKKISMLCLSMAIALCGALPVQAATGINVSYHTQEEIRAYANKDGVALADPLEFAEEPVTSAPFALGRVSDSTLSAAIKMLNQLRYIAGLSHNVSLDAQYNEFAQAASLVNYANNKMSHFPEQPAGMPNELFALAQKGAGSSNIAWASWRGWSLNDALVTSWMEDGGRSNISRVGHRRWLLNPVMGKTGFGAATGANGTHCAVYAFDRSNSSAKEYGVAWPAQNMPIEYFNTSFPWSISMGKELDASAVQVTLTRKSDGRQWHFSEASKDGEFYVNNEYYGQQGCIIFRPPSFDIGGYQDGDSYSVQVSGLPDGNVSYTVDFFRLYKIEQVLLTPDALNLKESDATVTLQATVLPANASDQKLSWEASDPSVVAVVPVNQKAYVTPQKAGTAQILVKDSQGAVLATCQVTVSHTPVMDEGKAPTCTTEGQTEGSHCAVCGAVLEEPEKIPATGHTPAVDEGKAPTCTAEGQTEGSHCAVCGVVLEEPEKIPATGHTPAVDEGKAPTCTAEGQTEGSHCAVCGVVLEEPVKIPATGHAWSQRELRPASPTEDGALSQVCQSCKAETSSVIPRPAAVRISPGSYTYNGKAQKPAVSVTARDGAEIGSQFYTITYQNNVNPGTATAVATFTGQYTGTMKAEFAILEPPKESISKAAATLAKSSCTYSGSPQKPAVTLRIGGKKLTAGKDYKLSYQNNKNVGKASVTITGMGSYRGKITKSFQILPQGTSLSKVTAQSKKLSIRWKRQSRAITGYQIQYSTSSKFAKSATALKTIKKPSTTSLNLKKFKPRKKYYIRIRTYKTIKGATYASSWSKAKSITTKK